jgi:hypothetical protein
MSRFIAAIFMVVFAGTEFVLVWFFFKKYIWVIPLVILSNIFFTWLLTNRFLLSFIVFPYAQPIVKYFNLKKINE